MKGSTVTDVDTIRLLAELVSIDSRNPVLVPGAPGEAQIAAFTATFLERHGFEVERVEPQPGRVSVVARCAAFLIS